MTKRKGFITLLTVGLALTAGALGGAQAHAVSGVEMAVPPNNTHCLDDDTNDFSNLQMWSCTGHAEQHWLEDLNRDNSYTFVNTNTNLCITAPASGVATVIMEPCIGAATQKWSVYAALSGPGSYDIWETEASGLCLRTTSVADHTPLETWPCDVSEAYERWHDQ
jgi:hypothetical protein